MESHLLQRCRGKKKGSSRGGRREKERLSKGHTPQSTSFRARNKTSKVCNSLLEQVRAQAKGRGGGYRVVNWGGKDARGLATVSGGKEQGSR